MKIIVITTLAEYINIIVTLKNETKTIWFRGVSSGKHFLTPSLFREKKIIGLKYSGEVNNWKYKKSDAVMKSDIKALDKFIKYYKKFYPVKSKNYKIIDYLYIMQHYDIPTRLLDFSTNELVALYFSVSKTKESEILQDEIDDCTNENGYSSKGSSIYCIDPIFTNKNTNKFKNLKSEILNIDDIDKDNLSAIDFPICIETNNSDKRIKAQSGVFMCFGSNYKGYEQYDIFNKKTTKIFIPNYCRKKIKDELDTKHNINHTTVYPDMKGIALEIIENIEDEYTKDCKKVFK